MTNHEHHWMGLDMAELTLDEIRRTALTAIASDDELVEIMVLKGGNALELIHKIGQRASVDLDFSVASDLKDVDDVRKRLFHALHDRFDSVGLLLFDTRFGPRPQSRTPGTKWGGYNAEFKLIDKQIAQDLEGDLEHMRRQALVSGPDHQRRFKIEISAFEYTRGRQQAEVDDYTCYVYSVEMIAVEKLRAICQQSPRYSQRAHPASRARDFYDIHATISEGGVDFGTPATQELVRQIFAAKEVDCTLIGTIHEQREFHRADWPAVEVAVRVKLRQFDYYFEYVLAEAEKLKTLWIE